MIIMINASKGVKKAKEGIGLLSNMAHRRATNTTPTQIAKAF